MSILIEKSTEEQVFMQIIDSQNTRDELNLGGM